MALPTLSRDTDLTETPAEPVAAPMLVAMAEPAGTMQQNMLNLNNQTAQTKQEDYLGQQREEEQLANIDLHAVNQGIDLLNKYYPSLGQVLAQPMQQMLPTDPLIVKQWTNTAQSAPQNQMNLIKNSQDKSLPQNGMNDPSSQSELNLNAQTTSIPDKQVGMPINQQTKAAVTKQDQGQLKDENRLVPENSQTDGSNRVSVNQQGKCFVSQCSIDKTTLKAIFGAEGYRSTVYNDATGKPIVDKSKWINGATIGYGHKVLSKEWLKYKDAVLTESEARKLAEHDLLEARNRLVDYIKVPVSQNVFNALLSRSYNGGYLAFKTKDSKNGSNSVVKWINSGKEPDPDNKQFRRAYQKFNTYLGKYSYGVEKRRIMEEDMMKNDYSQHDTRYYCQRSTYYSSESICMSHRRKAKKKKL